jgi:nicotinamide mononucleotide transporter
MSPLEILAAVLGVVNVALVALRRVANYPFGIASTAIFIWVFFAAKLYSDAALQVFYVALNVYGWWYWSRSRAQAGTVIVERLSWPARGGWAAGIVVAALGWGALERRFTDASYPWIDAGVAIASVAAQLLMSRRLIENWWLWIAIDLVSVPLYLAKHLVPTMILYTIFLGLSVWGLVDWQRARARA